MNKNLILILCFMVTTYACKNHDSAEESVFKVVMKVQSDYNTTFHMHYKEQGDENFTKHKVINGVILKGNEVEFKLPKNSFPISLRFDFGNKIVIQHYTFKSMLMTYEDLNMNLSLVEFNAFFSPNKYINFNKKNGEIYNKIINGKSDPYFISRPFFDKKLEIEKR